MLAGVSGRVGISLFESFYDQCYGWYGQGNQSPVIGIRDKLRGWVRFSVVIVRFKAVRAAIISICLRIASFFASVNRSLFHINFILAFLCGSNNDQGYHDRQFHGHYHDHCYW